MVAGKVTIYCESCAESREVNMTPKGNPRPPIGWRVIDGKTLCKSCFAEKYTTIALTVPVLSPKRLWETMSQQWQETTALANWAQDRLIANDIVRTPEMEKMPKMPNIYMYGVAKAEYPRWGMLPAAASQTVLRRVEQGWRSDRYEVLWSNARARRVYQYAQPWATSDFRLSSVEFEGEDRLAVSAKIGAERKTLILSREKGFRRQRKALESVLKSDLGKDACTELTLYRRKANTGDHREQAAAGGNGKESKTCWRIYAKICVLVPRSKQKNASGELLVKTQSDSLVEALDKKGERIWWYHGDHARRIVSKHEAHLSRLHRLADDRKYEKRKPKRQGQGFREMLGNVSRRDVRRMQQIADEVAASIVNFASRRKYAEVVYDDSDRSFAKNFRWSMLKEKLKSKCRMSGIEFSERSGAEKSTATPRKKKERSNANA